MGKQMTEMLKGTLEGIVLAVLSGRSAYGYEITAWLREKGFTDIAEGTVYAVLIRVEQRGQDLHDRGLARPVGAEQGENAASRHVEVNAAQHLQPLVGLLQTPNVDGCVGGHRCCPRSASSIALIRRARSLSIHCLPV